MTKHLKEKFDALACRLSPENLACDGECSPAETRRRRRQIEREWLRLERVAGKSVSIFDTYDW